MLWIPGWPRTTDNISRLKVFGQNLGNIVQWRLNGKSAEVILGMPSLANEVRADGVDRRFTEPNALEVKMQELDGDFGGHTLSIGCPDYDRDEISRVRYRIEDKVEQLPKDSPGLLVIFDSEFMTRDFEAPDYSWVVAGVEEAVFEYADLAGLLLVIDMGGIPKAPELAMSKDHWCAWRLHGPSILVQDRIFIRNRYSPYVLDERLLKAPGWPPQDERVPRGRAEE